MDFTEADLTVFTEATTRYFSANSTEAAEVGTPFLKGSENHMLDYTGVIGISGRIKGAVYYTASAETVGHLLTSMGMTPEEAQCDEVREDLVGEIANIFSGNARKVFGSNYMVSVPVVVKRGQQVHLPPYLSTFVLPILWRETRSYLIVCVANGSAIHGELRDIPAAEILGMAVRGSGWLRVRQVAGLEPLELYIHQGTVRRMLLEGQAVDNALVVRAKIAELLRARQGKYELVRGPMRDEGELELPLRQLIISGLAAPETAGGEEYLPLPETVYVYGQAEDCWLDPDTEFFLELTGVELRKGASAHTLAEQTRLPLAEILRKLHRLQTAGLISPARALPLAERVVKPLPATTPAASHTAAATPAHLPSPRLTSALSGTTTRPRSTPAQGAEGETAGVLGRVLNSLRRRLGQKPSAA